MAVSLPLCYVKMQVTKLGQNVKTTGTNPRLLGQIVTFVPVQLKYAPTCSVSCLFVAGASNCAVCCDGARKEFDLH